jgi:hypothetical protein
MERTFKKPKALSTKPLKYLDAEEQYSEHAFAALRDNFESKKRFDAFLNTISQPERKDLFLRLASFYRFMAKEGQLHFSRKLWCAGLDYIDDTFKYISIFALIEASFLKDEYLDFYQYLTKTKSSIKYPLDNREQLDLLHKKYKGEYGAIQNAVKFFEALDSKCKENLAAKLRVRPRPSTAKPGAIRRWEELSIIALSKRLYVMRSEFVHKAEFILALNAGPSLSIRGSKVVLSELTMRDIMTFFEHGLLIQFGYSGDLVH